MDPRQRGHLQRHENRESVVCLAGRKLGSSGMQRGYHRSPGQMRGHGGRQCGADDRDTAEENSWLKREV